MSQRLPARYFILHHAVTPLWDDKSKAWLAQWFSDTGFSRGYGSNPSNWSGLINPFTNQRSYAQAHVVGQRVTSKTPDATEAERKAGYRVFAIVKDIWNVITWGAGNWEVNRAAINIENLGDYRNYALREGDCRVIANFWRSHDQSRKGDTIIAGHQEVSQTPTACPSRIMEARNRIVDLVNNKHLSMSDFHDVSMLFDMKKNIPLYDLLTGRVITGSGSIIHITKKTDTAAIAINGVDHTIYLPVDRVANNQLYGFTEDDLWQNMRKKYEPAFTYRVIGKSTIYTGANKSTAQSVFEQTTPTKDDPTIQLLENDMVLKTKKYQTIYQVMVNDKIVYESHSENSAIVEYSKLEVNEQNKVISLLQDGVVVQTKSYTPPPQKVYRVYAGDLLIYEGVDAQHAQNMYEQTVPSQSVKVVQITLDDMLISRKVYTEPEPDKTLYDWLINLFTLIATWLKGWKR